MMLLSTASCRICARIARRSLCVAVQPAARPWRADLAASVVRRRLATSVDLPLSLTPSAVKQLNRIQAREANPGLALRVGVTSGGCSGYQYVLGLADTSKEDDVDKEEDQVIRFPAESTDGQSEPLVVVDNTSLALIRGSTIDFATELIGSAFRIMDNPQSKNKGCGCGVSWELRDDFELPDDP